MGGVSCEPMASGQSSEPVVVRSRRGRKALSVLCVGLVVAVALLFLTACLYFYGPWPARFVCVLKGPPGARVVGIDGEACDELLPYRVSRFQYLLRDPHCSVFEVESGGRRFRGRQTILGDGGFLTGHATFLGSVDSLDGSAWLREDFNAVVVRAPAQGTSWLAYMPWGKQGISVNGERIDSAATHFIPLVAGADARNQIHTDSWTLEVVAEAATCVQLSEWAGGGSGPTTLLRLADSGFARGTVGTRESRRDLSLGREERFDGEDCDLRLGASDGDAVARVRLWQRRGSGLQLTLRVSRDPRP